MLASTENLQSIVSKRLPNGKRKLAPHYRRWTNMKNRCYGTGKNTKGYKDRGITVCDEWKNNFYSFQQWCITTYEKGKSLDRIDNDKGYSPENCRWATPQEQSDNSRRHTPAIRQAAKLGTQASVVNKAKKYGVPGVRNNKYCSYCKTVKSNENFYKHSAAKDGLSGYCKPCNTKYKKAKK